MKRYMLLLVSLSLAVAQPAAAKLRVFACEPEWAALVRELGGGLVEVKSATTGVQDPHRIQARPSLIARMRRADLVVCTGAQLESGWLPLLLRRAANGRIQPGQPGYLEAARFVTLLDRPARLDRAEGDIHPAGNPHIHTDPRNIARVAQALGKRLMTLDPAHRSTYRARLDDFSKRWQAAITRWEAAAKELRGVPVVTQHKGWAYLIRWLGLREVATLEPKPGVPPSSAHLARVLARLEQDPAKMILRAAYQDPRPSEWLAGRAGIPAVVLPYTVGGTREAVDLFTLFDDTLRRLKETIR